MKKKSLTAQLMQNVGIPIIAVIFIVGAAAYISAKDEINEVYDSQMITAANALWLMNRGENITRTEIKSEPENTSLEQEDQAALDEYAKWGSIRLWKKDKLVVYSTSAQAETVKPYPKGFTNITLQGEQWRLFTLYVYDKNIVVEVAEKNEARTEIIGHIVFDLLLPLLLAVPIIVLFIWKGIQWGLRDLQRFAVTIRHRSSEDLSELNKGRVPKEIKPLVNSVNLLLNKLKSSLAQERLFTDNAAHELRTPLATLGIQADVVLNSKDEIEREQAILELAKGVRRASHMADQLLTMARIRQQPIEVSTLNLYAQARDAIKAVYPNVLKKQIECSLSGDEAIKISSKKPLLAILLTNLLDNAVKYTPEHGEVRIIIEHENNAPILRIEDTGPGIPENERDNVFKRFYRLPDNTETGSGLGLAIVQTISELIHVQVNFYTPETTEGLGIKLTFSPDYPKENKAKIPA
jgi:signal transduction histidine kinase